jgi:hypothetical protein
VKLTEQQAGVHAWSVPARCLPVGSKEVKDQGKSGERLGGLPPRWAARLGDFGRRLRGEEQRGEGSIEHIARVERVLVVELHGAVQLEDDEAAVGRG